MRRLSLLAALPLAAASHAFAQGQHTINSTVTYTLTAQDSYPNGTGNHNGEVEPGEGVLFRLSVSFTNQNQFVNFAPPLNGGISFGTVRGFSFGFIDIVGIGNQGGNANGIWDTDPANGFGPINAWDLVGPFGYGTPTNNGSNLTNIQFGQFPLSAAQTLTTNPINIYSAFWTPNSYGGRFVDFYIRESAAAVGTPSAVILQTSATGIISANCPSIFTHVSINVGIPAPSSLALLGLAGLTASRRRR